MMHGQKNIKVCSYYDLVLTNWASEVIWTYAKASAHVGLPLFVLVLSPLPDDIYRNDVSIRDIIDPAGMGKLSAATLHFQESQLTSRNCPTSEYWNTRVHTLLRAPECTPFLTELLLSFIKRKVVSVHASRV